MRIPSTPATTLSGLQVRVPDDFTGERNAALLLFDRSHLVAVPAWQAVLRDTVSDARAGFYIIILAGPTAGFRRQLTTLALRLEIADKALLADTAVIWEPPARWLSSAGIRQPSEPLLTVTSPDGVVHASAPGMPRPGLTARLADALKSE